MTNVNGTLFFSACNATDQYGGAANCELWKSNGTAAGTVFVKDIYPSAASSSIDWMTNVSGTLFFRACDASGYYGNPANCELWRSDGTTTGTALVKDIYPGTDSNGIPFGSAPRALTNVNGMLYFSADDAANGRELWQSDGTGPGTVLVQDINPGIAGSYPDWLTNLNGKLLFSANDGTHGIELWDPPRVASQVTSDESSALSPFGVRGRPRDSGVVSSTLSSLAAADVICSTTHSDRRHKHLEGFDRDEAPSRGRTAVIDDAVAFGVRHLMRDHSDSALSAHDLMGTRLLHITLPDDLLDDLCTLERL